MKPVKKRSEIGLLVLYELELVLLFEQDLKMFRMISSLFLVAMFVAVQSSPTPAPKDLMSSLLSVDRDEDMPTIGFQRSFGDLPNLLYTIKLQFREILEELFTQVISYILSVLQQLKVNLLRKLGLVTLADVTEGVLNFVTDLVVEPVIEDEPHYEPVRGTIQSSYNQRPFSLASLLSEK
ncbi:hypothetical protein evm_010519 [Chilo suppressalis]|nr:hypothetical protein evm_010519 [Chilo suppressalis]